MFAVNYYTFITLLQEPRLLCMTATAYDCIHVIAGGVRTYARICICSIQLWREGFLISQILVVVLARPIGTCVRHQTVKVFVN